MCRSIHNKPLTKGSISVCSASLVILLLAGVDAGATTIALTDSGISQYCEVVESESDFYKWVAIPGETENDPISIEYVLAGTRVTYDI